MKKNRLWYLVLVLLLSNCIVPQYISYDDIVRESKSEDYSIRIYSEDDLSGINYRIIGEVIVSDHTDVNVLIDLMKKKVREIGGDGIIELDVNGSNADVISGVNGVIVSSSHTSLFIKGKVIVILDE